MTEQSALPDGWMHVLVDVPHERAAESERFWSAALGWPLGEPFTAYPEFASFEPPDGESYVHRQRGDHGPRIHVDVEVADLARSGERLVELGASLERSGHDIRVLRSPGGLPFCLIERERTTRPGPVRWPDGHRTRPVQVCLDVPPALVDDEIAFWRAGLDWRWVPGEAEPEFVGRLRPDPRLPIQLLVQRLRDPEPAVRAHLDLGSDDIEAEVARLVGLGARRGSTGDGWVVLTDPTGLEFCVTRNPPD